MNELASATESTGLLPAMDAAAETAPAPSPSDPPAPDSTEEPAPTLEPTEEHKSVYTKAVDRVRSIGLDMRY